MKKSILYISGLLLLGCAGQPEETSQSEPVDSTETMLSPCLICVRNDAYEPAFINEKGDTIIPFGKYADAFTDTIYNFGSVYDTAKGFVGINQQGLELFEIYGFENGPDYIQEGMFRIVKDGLIGFANETGEVVIEPQFMCAYPFENGKAQVSKNCTETVEFEMTRWDSKEWYYIDKTGKIVEQ